MREFKLSDGRIVKCINDEDCVFCKHCKDIFFGLYPRHSIICELGEEPFTKACRFFTEVGVNNSQKTEKGERKTEEIL